MPADSLTIDTITDSADHLKRFAAAFASGDWVAEVRAFAVPQRFGRPQTLSGFFDLAAGARAVWDAVRPLLAVPPKEQPEGVYVTLNPLNPALLARCANRLKAAGRGVCAADADVVARRWLLIDVDPVRPAGVSSTDAEKAAARLVLDGVRADLDGRGWPAPLVLDSGNGFHLWYRIDLPAGDGRVERILKSLAARHDTAAAKVDTSVFNPSRVAKLPGTWARKGDSLPDRPHRMARVLEVPE